MAIQSNLSDVKVVLNLTRGSQTVANCNDEATPEQLHEFGVAIGNLHQEGVNSVKKVVEYDIVEEL